MKPKKEKALLIAGVAVGLVFQFIGISLGTHPRMPSGICLGIGSVLFAQSLNRLHRLSYEKEFPQMVRQEQIELADERNVQIRSLAKSKSGDLSRWAVVGLAWLSFLLYGPLWITLTLLGIFVLAYAVEWYYTDKYQKEM